MLQYSVVNKYFDTDSKKTTQSWKGTHESVHNHPFPIHGDKVRVSKKKKPTSRLKGDISFNSDNYIRIPYERADNVLGVVSHIGPDNKKTMTIAQGDGTYLYRHDDSFIYEQDKTNYLSKRQKVDADIARRYYLSRAKNSEVKEMPIFSSEGEEDKSSDNDYDPNE